MKTEIMTVKRTNLLTLLSNEINNFTIYFEKKDGQERVLYCNVMTGFPLIDDNSTKYINVKAVLEDDIRKVNIDTVSYITKGNFVYKLID